MYWRCEYRITQQTILWLEKQVFLRAMLFFPLWDYLDQLNFSFKNSKVPTP